jgi:two-component system, NarL family, response regulator DevR
MENKTSVFMLGCNRLVRESIARILIKKPGFEVVANQAVGPTSCDEINRAAADILVLDSLQFLLRNPSLSLTTDTFGRGIRCVLVAMEDDPDHFLMAIRRGVLGYVLQQASAADVVSAIRAVADGDAICPPRYARTLFNCIAQQAADLPSSHRRSAAGLTRRQQQLVPLIGKGLSNKEIAQQLGLSEQTVKNHVHRILRKVGVPDRLSVYEACQLQMSRSPKVTGYPA